MFGKNKEITATALVIVALLFSLNVIWQTYDKYATKFSVSEEQSKVCLVKLLS